MLTHPTLDKLRTLQLSGMINALTEQQQLPEIETFGFEERLGLLADRELTEREHRRLQTRLRQAHLRQSAGLEDLDLRTPRGLDKGTDPALGHRPMAARTPQRPHRRSHRDWQDLAGLRLGASGLSPRLHRDLSAPAAPPGRPRPGPWGWPLPQAPRGAGQDRSPRPG